LALFHIRKLTDICVSNPSSDQEHKNITILPVGNPQSLLAVTQDGKLKVFRRTPQGEFQIRRS